jgi:hypothetical protein
MQCRRPGRQSGLAGLDRRRRRAVQVELVAGNAGRIDVDDRQRGGRVGGGLDGDQHPVAVKIGSQQPPEPVTGQPAEEGRRLTKPGDGARDVEWAATEPGIDLTGRIHDEVDQDLACDGNHALPLRRESVTGGPGRGHYIPGPKL